MVPKCSDTFCKDFFFFLLIKKTFFTLIKLLLLNRNAYSQYGTDKLYFPLLFPTQGVDQWLLLVLLWQGRHRWPRQKEFLQSYDSGKTDIQQSNWIYSGRIWTHHAFNTGWLLVWLCVTYQLSLQGPCTGNQQSLAHSRLWDAIVGFLHVFAHMMMKLAQVRTYNFMNSHHIQMEIIDLP